MLYPDRGVCYDNSWIACVNRRESKLWPWLLPWTLCCPRWRVFPPSLKTEFEPVFEQFVRAADICVWSSSIGRLNELGSLIPSRRTEKTKEPDFGTYHHSTSVASKKARIVVKAMFTDAFTSLSSHLPKSSTSSSLTSCFITLGRCDPRPTTAFHRGHRPGPSS